MRHREGIPPVGSKTMKRKQPLESYKLDPAIHAVALNRSLEIFEATLKVNDYNLKPALVAVYAQGIADCVSIFDKGDKVFEHGAGI